MRIPRDLDGKTLVRRLGSLGYVQTRQSGSHVRLTRESETGQHHVTVPMHSPIRVGTLNAIVSDIASHLGTDKEEVIRRIAFG